MTTILLALEAALAEAQPLPEVDVDWSEDAVRDVRRCGELFIRCGRSADHCTHPVTPLIAHLLNTAPALLLAVKAGIAWAKADDDFMAATGVQYPDREQAGALLDVRANAYKALRAALAPLLEGKS